MVIQEPERQVHIQHSFGVKLDGSRLDRVNLETALYKKTLVLCFVYSLDPFVKDQIVRYAQVHNTHTCFKFHVLVFGLTDLSFYEQIESKQVYMI